MKIQLNMLTLLESSGLAHYKNGQKKLRAMSAHFLKIFNAKKLTLLFMSVIVFHILYTWISSISSWTLNASKTVGTYNSANLPKRRTFRRQDLPVAPLPTITSLRSTT